MIDGSVESGVPHAALFSEFVEALAEGDAERLARVRDAIGQLLGPEAVVDTAGATASFNAVVKVADGSGVQVEEFKVELIRQLPKKLGDQLGHAL